MKRHAHPGVVQRFFAFLAQHNLDGSRLAVAFSGGPDSTAAAICAAEAIRAGRLVTAVAVHVDHGARPESRHEAARAASMAETIGLPYRVVHLELSSGPTEGEMRDARYAQLAQAMSAEHLDVLVTGHHRRDQAETVLLHLVRGTGMEGVSGMAPLELLPTAAGPLNVARPFLAEDPHQLSALVRSMGLEPIVDPSNLEIAFRRNFVRHEILPRMAEVNPDAELHIARCAEIVAAEDEFLDTHCAALLPEVVVNDSLNGPALLLHHPAIQRRLIRLWIASQLTIELRFDRVEAVRAAVLAGTGNVTIQLGDGWEAFQSDRRFTLRKSETGKGEYGVES